MSQTATKVLSTKMIILAYALIFIQASLSKIIPLSTPTWFIDQFRGTLLDWGGFSLPFFYWILAISESVAAVLFSIALFQKKNHQRSQRKLLFSALMMAQVLFILLMFGQRLTHHYDESALLFFYSLGTFLLIHFFHHEWIYE